MFNISYEIIFSTVGVLSFIGWGALVFSPLHHVALTLVARVISIVLALIYTNLLVSLWGHEAKVDLSFLEVVADGFSYMGHLLSGWIHLLALDLFLGAL
ncbi:MAG: abscisic acid-deficient protein Aba4 family protein [Oceanospirillaceae bacterium]